jgi:hypothetical protein
MAGIPINIQSAALIATLVFSRTNASKFAATTSDPRSGT